MYTGLHVKYPLFLSDFNGTLIFFLNSQIRHFMKIRPWEPSCFMRTDGWTDGQT